MMEEKEKEPTPYLRKHGQMKERMSVFLKQLDPRTFRSYWGFSSCLFNTTPRSIGRRGLSPQPLFCWVLNMLPISAETPSEELLTGEAPA